MTDVYAILTEVQKAGLNCTLKASHDKITKKNNIYLIEPDHSNPSWLDIFYKFFVNDVNAEHDDMLFYVKLQNKATTDSTIFVTRKPKTPELFSEPSLTINWRESLFLNIIAQMKCSLTVTIFKKIQLSLDSPPSTIIRDIYKKHIFGLPNLPQILKTNKNSSLPTFSWPHVYFLVEDLEDSISRVTLNPDEFLCIELSTIISSDSSSSASSPNQSLSTSPNLSASASPNQNPPVYSDEKSPPSYYKQLGDSVNSANNTPSHFYNGPSIQMLQCSSKYKKLNSTRKDHKVTLLKSTASYDFLSEAYITKQNSGNILSRLRSATPQLEYMDLKNQLGSSGSLQLGLQGCEFLPNSFLKSVSRYGGDNGNANDEFDEYYDENGGNNACYLNSNSAHYNLNLSSRINDDFNFGSNRASSVPLFSISEKPSTLSPNQRQRQRQRQRQMQMQMQIQGQKQSNLKPKFTNQNNQPAPHLAGSIGFGCTEMRRNVVKAKSNTISMTIPPHSPFQISLTVPPQTHASIPVPLLLPLPALNDAPDTAFNDSLEGVRYFERLKHVEMLTFTPEKSPSSNTSALESLCKHQYHHQNQIQNQIQSQNQTQQSKNQPSSLAKWMQRFKLPLISDNSRYGLGLGLNFNLGFGLQQRPPPESLDVHLKHICIPWDDIIRSVLFVKNNLDLEINNQLVK